MTRNSMIGYAVLALALVPGLVSAAPTGRVTVLSNGNIVTQDAEDRHVEAVAIVDDRVLAIGRREDVLRRAGDVICEVDLQGRTVVPGFIDGHLHSKILSTRENVVNLTPVRDLDELLTALATRIAELGPGEVVVTNSDWHEGQLTEQRLPNRWDLDTISPENPVVVIRGGHHYILNSIALEKWNITGATQSPAGGQITVDPARGEINGELVDRARELVELPPPPSRTLEQRLTLLQEEHRNLNRLGLTGFREPGAPIELMRDYIVLERRGEMTIRTSVLIRWDRRTPAAQYRQFLETWPILSSFGSDYVRLDGIKIGVDGGYEGGWMRDPYRGELGQGGGYYGLNTVPAEVFVDIVRMLNELDLRPSTHAVGDAAIDLVLEGYEAAHRDRSIRDRRWVIEHAFITQPEQIERIADLGIVISAQSHLFLAAPSLLQFWGPERTREVAPVRSWIDAGIVVAGGTDNKLPYIPEDPITTFYHWVTRDTGGAGIQGPEQAITRREALRVATINNAYATFEEDLKGSLEPGKFADLVVLSQDILTVPAEHIRDTEVLGTMVGGRFVYEAEGSALGCAQSP